MLLAVKPTQLRQSIAIHKTQFQYQQILLTLVRKQFTFTYNHNLPQLPFHTYQSLIRSQSIILIYLLEKSFFIQLTQRLNRQDKKTHKIKQTINVRMNQFIKIIEAKLSIITQLITSTIYLLNQYLNFNNQLADDPIKLEYQNLFEQQLQIKQFLFPNTCQFLQKYYQKSKKENKFLISQTFVGQSRVQTDKLLKNYINLQIQKMIPIKNSTFKRIQINQAHRIQFPYKFIYKQFIDKLLLKLFQLQSKYYPQTQNNNDNNNDSNYQKEVTGSTLMGSTMMSTQNSIKNVSKSASGGSTLCTLNSTNITNKSIFLVSLEKNIEIQDFVSTKCINCAQFFYKDVPFQSQRNSIVDYQVINSVRSIKKQYVNILQHITALLNNGGGTLIFDCKQTIFGFLPSGQKMNNKQQQGYKHSFQNLLKYIKPQQNRKLVEYEIHFIPLKLDPIKSPGTLQRDTHTSSIQRGFVPQSYVMRVKIRSKGNREFFGCEIDKRDYFYIRQNNKTKSIQGSELYKQMQKKSYYNYPLKNKTQILKLKQIYEQKQVNQILSGNKQNENNLHQGCCKQPLIISTLKQSIRR